eukprot:TRINITY_DN29538_c0_g2_i1.p1 TRINITY_DN29538_c0_g2~~TRINITY_DN29538_c0_g2_i1.p1  ORF type:complete len:586 (+),score=83.27 TRINITY_DN29538_c0_g2_i1:120-1877(+)
MAKKAPGPVVGVLRLDFDHPASPGDIAHPESFACKVIFRVVPGLTLGLCQAGKLPRDVELRFIEGIRWLDSHNVSGITGSCGFMMFLQDLARQNTRTPVFLSSLVQLPSLTRAFGGQIAICTSNGKQIFSMEGLLKRECGIDENDNRFVIVGFDDLLGHEAVALGTQVDVVKGMPAVVSRARAVIAKHPDIRAIVIECAEMPSYANALRAVTGLPVFDAITCVDLFVGGRCDNPRFGMQDWQEVWDGKHDEYSFAMELDSEDQAKLVNPIVSAGSALSLVTPSDQIAALARTDLAKELVASKKAAPVLGILRLDYEYVPSLGDVDHPDSFNCRVVYRVVQGMTFDMCKAGAFPEDVELRFIEAIKWLDAQNVTCITSDCGFLLWLQDLARQHTRKPVFLSSLVKLPAVNSSFGRAGKVAIFTSNGEALAPMESLIKRVCAVEPSDDRFVIVGCENVPGFEAVALGQTVDVFKTTPGILERAREVLNSQPEIRAIMLECSEMPPFADALKSSTGLPVFSAISTADFFTSASTSNPRFGLQGWQDVWGAVQDDIRSEQKSNAEDMVKRGQKRASERELSLAAVRART